MSPDRHRRPDPGRTMWVLAVASLLGFGVGLVRSIVPAGEALRMPLQTALLALCALTVIGTRLGVPLTVRAIWPMLGVLALALVSASLSPLALDGGAPLIYAALVLLLATSVTRLLTPLRRQLRGASGARPSWAFFAVPLVVYLALMPWGHGQRPPDGDEPYYLLLTHSLAYDFDLDLANNYQAEDWRGFLERPIAPQPGDPEGPGGAIYSRHNALLPLVLAPFYRLAGVGGALLAMGAMAAALAWSFLFLARRRFPSMASGAFLAWLILAFGPPLLLYSHQIWIEVPAALLLTSALLIVLDPNDTPRLGRRLRLGASLALLPLLKLRLAAVALPTLGIVLARRRRGAPTWLPAALMLAALIGLMLLNQMRFGNPLKMHDWRELMQLASAPTTFLRGGLGMFYDLAFGLFATAPVWLLLLPALWRARTDARLRTALAVIALPCLLLIAPRIEWYGGWSPPFRYPLVLLPLLALALVPLLDDRRSNARRLVRALGMGTALLTLLWLAVPGWTYNLADGGNHVLDAAGHRFGVDVARFFPSMVRPRLATWLWPIASLAIVPLALSRRRRLPIGATPALIAVAGTALLMIAATKVPTGRIEVEDGHVRAPGCDLHPPPWTVARPRFRSGWVVVGRQCRVVAPVVGTGRVRMTIAARLIQNDPDVSFSLDIGRGSTPLAQVPIRDTDWQNLEIGPFDWPETAALVLRGRSGRGTTGKRNGVVIDRVDLEWVDEETP